MLLTQLWSFYANEEELQLFGDLNNKKVLDIGYGSGHSLRYMADNGVSELWGVDISESQKAAAEETLKVYIRAYIVHLWKLIAIYQRTILIMFTLFMLLGGQRT